MADSEIRNVLRLVREAETQVAAAKQAGGLSAAEQKLLTDLFDFLEDFDDTLVEIDLQQSLAKIQTGSKRLTALNKKVKAKAAKLAKVAKAVDAAAKGAEAFVKAFGILSGAGLL